MLCKVQLFCFLILISDYCCPECLVIVVACFVTRVCDSNEACHLKNSLCILEKPVSLKTLDKVLVEHPRATDWEEWLSYIAYSFFFLSVSCLVWCYHRPGPAPGEQNKLTGAVAQNKVGFCFSTQDKEPLWLHSPGLPLWNYGVGDACVGKRLILEISSRWALNSSHSLINNSFSLCQSAMK